MFSKLSHLNVVFLGFIVNKAVGGQVPASIRARLPPQAEAIEEEPEIETADDIESLS